MTQTKSKAVVNVNYGNVLESKLNEWKGGSRHPYGIAEYINNSDDSYRRLGNFSDQEIFVEIHTRTAKRINKLIIKDNAEGMSYEDLENKFFQYFDSYSGRSSGAKVRGQFGTGGKAYAIMNFRNCWIESVKDGLKSKARFYWDHNHKQIMKEYDNGGFVNQPTTQPNGTIIVLEEAIKVNTNPEGFVDYLEKLPGLRHVLKGQKVHYTVKKKSQVTSTDLIYRTPSSGIIKSYTFDLPEGFRNSESSNEFQVNYFEQPIGNDAFIDISDGISSVEDMEVTKIDGRPFSKYINGSLVIEKLQGSTAIKENRRGLEDGDDLTEEILGFISSCISSVINEIEKEQKEKDKLKRLEEANKKLDELSKFLSKRDLKFKLDLKELKKRFSTEDFDDDSDEESPQINNSNKFRKPTESDPEEDLVKGRWTVIEGNGDSENHNPQQEFIPDENGHDEAVRVGNKKSKKEKTESNKKGIQVLFSNDPNNHDSPSFTEFDEPVSDRDLQSNGIIWINSNHPIIAKNLNTDDKVKLIVRDENIANYVLMMIAQYYALKEIELQPENEAADFMLSYRKHFFELQTALRMDHDVQFFDDSE